MFSRASGDKGKRKSRKGHKSTPKSGNPAQSTISVDEEPDNLSFLYRIDALETKYGDHRARIVPVGGSKGNDIAKLWFPPLYASQFYRSPGNLYRWLGEYPAEIVEEHERPEKLEKFAVASVFFQARQDNFLAVWKDCSKRDLVEEPYGWSQIGFHHQPKLMSMVDIGGDKFTLAAAANGSSWMPQVLPEVYNYDTRGPHAAPSPGPPGGLCGRLSLLIAMAAFSAPVSDAEAVVSQNFGYKIWRRHQFETGIGRYQERGVVVSIYMDPDADGVTPNHLKAFEEGKYGPIFVHDAPSRAPQPMPQSIGYTYSAASPTGYVPGSPSSIPRILHMNTAPSGLPASTGNTAPHAYLTSQLTDSTELYDAEDSQPVDQPEEEEN